jgi:stress-induced-phosphoprotein 1
MQYLDMGNNAFQDERWDDAITYYTQAIAKGQDDGMMYRCYSNRSAAHLKKGDFASALEDAGKCIAIKPTFHKGHIRRVAVYHQMEDYQDAVDAYKEGLKHCPDDKTLQRGLKVALKKLATKNEPDMEAEKVLKTFKF